MRGTLLFGALLVAACGSSVNPGQSDGGAGDDAAVSGGDASASCAQWRLVSVDVTGAQSMEALAVNPERTARIMITALHCPGDIPAPPIVAPTLENEYLSIDARVWRAAPACATPTEVQRPIPVRFPYPGQWKIVHAGGMLTVDVTAAPDVACSPVGTNRCDLDCQCAPGQACLSGVGFAGPYTECARPCELDRECGGVGSCESFEDTLQLVCQPGDECDAQTPCPDGFDCNAGSCEPTFVLDNTSRHVCSCDAECDPGLHCAWQSGASEGRCDAVCRTRSDGWCQGPHTCGAGSVEPASDAVCAWVGD